MKYRDTLALPVLSDGLALGLDGVVGLVPVPVPVPEPGAGLELGLVLGGVVVGLVLLGRGRGGTNVIVIVGAGGLGLRLGLGLFIGIGSYGYGSSNSGGSPLNPATKILSHPNGTTQHTIPSAINLPSSQSDASILMSLYVPASPFLGVHSKVPVSGSKVAPAGKLLAVNVNLSPSGSLAETVKVKVPPSFTVRVL